MQAVSVNADDYLPWDRLRSKVPPEGLTRQQWWSVTKLQRRSIGRKLPLVDKNGIPFNYVLPDQVLKLIDNINRRAGGQIGMAEQVTNPSTRDRYVVSALIEESITSSQLEGASTTRRVAKQMLLSGRSPRDKSEQMIANNYAAMRFVTEHQAESLTVDLICELHAIVTGGTLDDPDDAGRIQSNPDPKDRVEVVNEYDEILHAPPPVEQLPARIVALCDFANQSSQSSGPWMSPVLRAVTIHFMIGYDHYFVDGNGRTARALFYWSMLNQELWLTEFITISNILKRAPKKYSDSYLNTEYDDGDLTYFYLYHLGVIDRAFDDLEVYLETKMAEVQRVRQLLTTSQSQYNHRQLALLELGLKDPGVVFTARSHATSHNVSGETARQDLQELADRDLLVRGKDGRQFVWRPVTDLSRALQR